MKRISTHTSILALGLISLVCLLAGPAEGRQVTDLRLGRHSDHTRLVIDLTDRFTYRLSRPSPDKAVIYFSGARLKRGPVLVRSGLDLVARARAVERDGGVAVEIDLNGPGTVKPFAWESANRLVLEIKPDRAGRAARSIARIAPPKAVKPARNAEPAGDRAPARADRPAEENAPAAASTQYPLKTTAKRTVSPSVGPKVAEPAEPKIAEPVVRAEKPAGPKGSATDSRTLGLFMDSQPVRAPAGLIRIGGRKPETAPPAKAEIDSPRKIGGGIEKPGLKALDDKVADQAGSSAVTQNLTSPRRPKIKDVVDQAKALAEDVITETMDPEEAAFKLLTAAKEDMAQDRFQQAEARLNKAAELSPNSDYGKEAFYLRADALFRLNQATGQPPFQVVENAYQKALGADPANPAAAAALFRMGLVNFQGQNLDKAKGYFGLVLSDHADSPVVGVTKLYLARTMLLETRVQPAVRMLREVVEKGGKSDVVRDALWYLGRALFEVGRYAEAYLRLGALRDGWPKFKLRNPSLYYYLGETAFRLDKLKEAQDHLFWVVNVDPAVENRDLIMARLGDIYIQRNKAYKAVALYTEAERLFPDSDGALIAKLRLAEIEGEADKTAKKLAKVFNIQTYGSAVKTYKKIMESYGDRPVAQLAMLKLGAWHYSQSDYLKAYEILDEMLEKYPQSEFYKDAVFALRQSFGKQIHKYHDEKKASALLEFWDAHKNRVPSQLRSPLLSLVGDAYLRLGIYGEAAIYLEDSINRGEGKAGAFVNLGECYYQMRNWEKAAEIMARFFNDYPQSPKIPDVAYQRGVSLIHLGRYGEAIGDLKRAMRRDGSKRMEAATMLAEAMIKADRPAEAVPVLLNILSKTKELEAKRPVLAKLGTVYQAMGKFDQAAGALAQATAGLEPKGSNLGLFYQLGEVYLSAGRDKDGRAVLNQVAQSADSFWQKMALDRLAVADAGSRPGKQLEAAKQ